MCGIVGYVGAQEATDILVQGLSRLEYRGYDSAGVAVQNGRGIVTRKVAGRVVQLETLVKREPVHGRSGIGHTRWATHGAPNHQNAHPHTDCTGTIALVHNGIIENCDTLRRLLTESGHAFRTDTDSEVVAHLIEASTESSLEARVADALRWVEGTYGLAVMSSAEPGKVVVARKGSPVLIGIGENEFWIASDPSACARAPRSVVYLDDGDMAVVTRDGYRIVDAALTTHTRSVNRIDWSPGAIERGGYDHFMLKEIYEQPASVRNTMRGRLLVEEESTRLNGLRLDAEECRRLERVVIVACGTSWHSGLIARAMFEELTGLPVQVEYGSEFRYQTQLPLPNSLVIAISQSGETADTLEAMRAARAAGGRVVGVVNVVGSTIAREADGGVYLHAGPEIGVASTKAFTCQVTALALIALHIGKARGMCDERARRLIHELERLPDLIEQTLALDEQVRGVAAIYANARNALYLGRGVNFPVALEGALKLKEISYIHAEGLPAAEMKHGPIALIDEDMPVVFVAPKDHVYEKVVSNIQEVKARGGRIVVVATEGNSCLAHLADHVLLVPATDPLLSPLLTVVPLQLLAYHIAVLRGCDVDRPRNLAKSVTVE